MLDIFVLIWINHSLYSNIMRVFHIKQSQAIVSDIVLEMWKYACKYLVIHQYFISYLLKWLCWLLFVLLSRPHMLCDLIRQDPNKDMKCILHLFRYTEICKLFLTASMLYHIFQRWVIRYVLSLNASIWRDWGCQDEGPVAKRLKKITVFLCNADTAHSSVLLSTHISFPSEI